MIGEICKFIEVHKTAQIPLWHPDISDGSLVLIIDRLYANYFAVLTKEGIHEVSDQYLRACKSTQEVT